MRHTIMGTCAMISRIGSVLAPQWQVLNNLLNGLPFYMFAITCVISAGLIFFLPETLHKELPDSIEEAEQLGKKHRRR
ncbi:Solute carrier family 22 member 6-A [Blattella germanica]|nr:Solute carrier family 22 member 6-A [Blattella germanica]